MPEPVVFIMFYSTCITRQIQMFLPKGSDEEEGESLVGHTCRDQD